MRIIGHYVGSAPGPLVIAIGGIHGNEPAGVYALERLFDLLEEEPLVNPGFSFRGELLALRGNVAALSSGRRYIDVDLNRIWPDANQPVTTGTSSEARELDDLLAIIEDVAEASPLSDIVLLDLHTTTARSGIFSVTGDDDPSLLLAAEMGVPVIRGMLDGMSNTTLHYFRKKNFPGERSVRAISFEAGNHDDPGSVDRAVAATVSLLRALGCVQEEDVSTHHDETLREAAGQLPILTELVYVHKLPRKRDNDFRMLPGFTNFQPVRAGTLLATDRDGDIRAAETGYVLMPLYQELGEEGFFLIRDYHPPTGY